jgi:hypothetical protein
MSQRGRPQTNFSCPDRGADRRERRINVGTIRHLFVPGTGAACQIPAPRRVWYNGVPVVPRAVFAVFGWSSGAEKWTRGGPYKLLAGVIVAWRSSSGVGARLLPGRRGAHWRLHEVVQN